MEYLVAEAVLLQLLLSNYLKSHLLNEKIGNLVILYIQPGHHSQLFLDAALPYIYFYQGFIDEAHASIEENHL